MKQKFMWTIVCACVCFVMGCKRNNCTGEVTKINDNMETFTVLDAQGNTLLGLRHSKNGSTLVPADTYDEITVEKDVIVCTKLLTQGIKEYYVFLKQGEFLGRYDTFIRWDDVDRLYYMGTSYSYSEFYFPKTEKKFRAHDIYQGRDVLFLQAKENETDMLKWICLSYNGEIFWNDIPENSTLIKIEDESRMENFYILTTSGQLYDYKGNLVHKLTPKQQKSMQKKFQQTISKSNITIVLLDGKLEF